MIKLDLTLDDLGIQYFKKALSQFCDILFCFNENGYLMMSPKLVYNFWAQAAFLPQPPK